MSSILALILRSKIPVLMIFLLLMIGGLYAIRFIPIDAVPDVTPVQVVVNTKTGALDPEQTEKAVSYPIESEMSGIGGVTEVRSLSKYGLSQVVVVFADGTNIYWARQQIAERLQNVRDSLPPSLSPELAPITTGLGEVLMYVVLPKVDSDLAKMSPEERLLYLRTVQDFVIKRAIKANVSNIAEVDSNGGYEREIHIDVDPTKLEKNGLSIEELVARLETLGESFGGGYIQTKGKQVIVRSIGALQNLDQLRNVPIKINFLGQPVRLEQVAHVRDGYVQRLGGATYNGEETVLGTVLMLSNANSRQVAIDAEQALRKIELPDDVEIKIVYSRRYLVEETIKTVAKNLSEGALLVVLVLLLILGNFRAAIIVALCIPFSMLLAAIGMRYFGISANLMSLGAIDFGLLVDAAVVIVENIVRKSQERKKRLNKEERFSLVLESVKEVMAPVSVGLLLIMFVYTPILALEGIEGKIFKPMAVTVLMALGSSLVVALILMPVLAYIFVSNPQKHRDSLIFRAIKWAYEPVLRISLRLHIPLALAACLLIGISIFIYGKLGATFMPSLDEQDMIINLVRHSSIGIDESVRQQEQAESIIRKFPEVRHVFSRIGTAEAATDPMGVHLADTFLILEKDQNKWPIIADGKRRTKDALFVAIKNAIEKEMPEQEIMQSQPIEMRFNEILEGSRADVSLRIYGKDLEKLMDLVGSAKEIVEKVPGASEVELDALTALRRSPVLNVKLNYEKVTQYGIHIDEANRLLEMAMGGTTVGSFYENQWRFPIVVRLTEEIRENPEELKKLPVGLPEGGTLPLAMLASIEEKNQVTTIAHEQGNRYAAVSINLASRDTEGYVLQAKEALASKISLPEGYSLVWGGQFKNLERARGKLQFLVPLTLLVIFLAVFSTLKSLKETILIYLSIPFAMTGGVLSLYIVGLPFTISAGIGFIALSGIAILNALVLVTFFNRLRISGASAEEAAIQGTLARLRPVLMTALVAGFGFVPMAISTGVGSEMQRPLAIVVVGGLITSTTLTLLILPALYYWIFKEKKVEVSRKSTVTET